VYSAEALESRVGGLDDRGLDVSPGAVTVRECNVIDSADCRSAKHERRWNDQESEHCHNFARLFETSTVGESHKRPAACTDVERATSYR
jgi:hypothetical protein